MKFKTTDTLDIVVRLIAKEKAESAPKLKKPKHDLKSLAFYFSENENDREIYKSVLNIINRLQND
tara:strand:- start:2569 stop:2763 length:195 start_codon:yes stop_codon:yes gene_type:complete